MRLHKRLLAIGSGRGSPGGHKRLESGWGRNITPFKHGPAPILRMH